MITLLVVEDEPHQRELCRMELEEAGYRVVLASNGAEAIRKTKEAPPDMVILDLRLQDARGTEVLGRLMEQNPDLPVIIYSGYERFKENFMTWAADAYVIKSSDLDILKQEVARVLKLRTTKRNQRSKRQQQP